MTKKTIPIAAPAAKPLNAPKKRSINDIGRVRRVARKLLKKVDDHIEADPLLDDGWRNTYERLFGKIAPADTLMTLADLFSKLDQADPPAQETAALPEMPLAASDIALVEAFIRRVQNGQNT